ncbi:SDR family NAD(P)-dependent oxidoreductase [Chachezhania sediminis]|uniref:SDR family NAD(P)-dependent oxidoreductase n=1 Tax=Chachezhania sediminis TaxID=2599291 RepID=UPI00131D51EE|nr:SDR family NAD(P)-dependent oxidoreductase [Chachezhania sediminis]
MAGISEAGGAFTGRVAVVTGASRGIGLDVALKLAAGGARVALWARQPDPLAAAAAKVGDDTLTVPVDVADEAQVKDAAARTLDRFGKVDILVNNAGILGPRAAVGDYPADTFARVMGVNLMGTFHCCSALVPQMAALGWGRIVNVSSAAGKDGNPFVSAYACSKAAQIAFTKSLGKELARTGVLVNAVTPSASPTDIFGGMDEDRQRALLANVPMGRFVETAEIARLILWLCSEDCSFSTAATFDISGGRCTY